MTMQSNLGVVLDLLREAPELQSDDDLLVRGESSVTPERREAVVDHIRRDTDAQLTLFLLATELKTGGADSEEALREELRGFAEAVHARFGVNLLRTAAANRERVPSRVPDELFTDEAIAALDA